MLEQWKPVVKYVLQLFLTQQGAATVEGAVIEGAICSPLFVTRKEQGNRFLTNIIDTPHLTDRLKALIDQSDAFIVLPGKLGTALELMLVWNISYIEGIFTPDSVRKQIFAFREPWERIVQVMTEQLDLDKNRDVPLVTFVDTVDEIMEKLAELQSKV
jgi:predicted Rossmann-fold nucleotide-binding protein